MIVTAFNALSGLRVLRAMVASPEFMIRFVIHFFELCKVVSDDLWRWAAPRIFGSGHFGSTRYNNKIFMPSVVL